jgi:hypothetical protein
MKHKTLCQLFGVTESTVSRDLKSTLNLVLASLQMNIDAAIVWPNNATKAEFASLIHHREPLVSNAFGFVDGLNLHTECSSESNEQNAYYNAWLSDTVVANIFVFSPLGILFCLNMNKLVITR